MRRAGSERSELGAATAATAPTLCLRDVVKSYPMGAEIVHALSGVSLDVWKNEYVAIMGPSGSGKSTLMNIIGCLDVPTSGSYMLEGQAVAAMTETQLAEIRNKRIGFVFQTFNLLPRADVFHNVELPLIDTKTGDSIMEMLDQLHAAGQTIILVTHEEYIAAYARRTVRLRDGLIESDLSTGVSRGLVAPAESDPDARHAAAATAVGAFAG